MTRLPACAAVPLVPDPRDTLRAAIEASGLSARRFAREILAGRDERTVRRWLSGEVEMPPGVAEWVASLAAVESTAAHTAIRLNWTR